MHFDGLLFVCVILIVFCMRCESDSLDITKRKLEFIYPRNGDTLLLFCRDSVCSGDVLVAGFFIDTIVTIEPRSYELHMKVFDHTDTFISDATIQPLVSFVVSVTVPWQSLSVPISFSIKDVPTGVVLYQSDTLHQVVVTSSDFGSAMLSPTLHYSSVGSVVDFIEIGTSNYETATHAAAVLLSTGVVPSINGVAVEAVRQYITALPEVDGCQRINAAITTSELEDMVAVFYLPESVIEKTKIYHLNRGCSVVDTLGYHITAQVALGSVPSSAVQKAYVPALTIDRLLRESVQPGQRLRLLKSDMEGMDQPVMHQMLDHYERRTGEAVITAEWPCVVFFEAFWNGAPIPDEKLFHRFNYIGYSFFDGLVDSKGEPSDSDAMAVNCLCDVMDISLALALLAPQYFDLDAVLSVC